MALETNRKHPAITPLVGSIAALLLCAPAPIRAVTTGPTIATWSASPLDSDFNNPSNWSPTSPTGLTDTATFGNSPVTNLTFSNAFTTIGGIAFNPGAGAYTVTVGGSLLELHGSGITNNSGKVQTFIVGLPDGTTGTFDFFGSASAGTNTVIKILGAGTAGSGSSVHFWNNSNAGGDGVVIIVTGGGGIFMRGGVDVNGGGVYFEDNSNGGKAAFKVFGNGFLDLSPHNAGSVTIGSLEGTGKVFLGATNIVIGSNNLSTVFQGTIQGDGGEGGPFKGSSGSLTKIGTGTLNLMGQNTYKGNTYVNGGTLLVNGSILSPQTWVNAGGTLGGSGLIGGTVIVIGGTLSPGNSPGTLNIRGDYFQNSASTFAMQIASKDVYDHLNVGGAASLSGTLAIDVLSGAKIKRGETFQFLTASRGIVGEFGDVIQPDTGTILGFKVEYLGNAVQLESIALPFTGLPGLTPNQFAVAQELDRISNDHRTGKLINFLIGEPLGKLSADFDKIAPEEYTSIFTIGTSFDNVQTFNLQRRTDDIRAGASGFSAAGFATAGSGPFYSGAFAGGLAGPNGNDGKEVKETKNVIAPENRWGVFITGVGEWVGVGDDFNARGYDIATGGFTVGVDYRVCPNFAVGLMAGYVGTGVDLNDGGRVFVNGGKLGIYGTCFQNAPAAAAPAMSKDSSKEAPAPAVQMARGLYGDFAVTGGYSSYDVRRSALNGTARGDTDGGDLNVLVGLGYDFKSGGLTFGPTATFNYTYVGIGDFDETGSLAPLHFKSQGQESIRSALGARVSYDWRVGGVVIKPELRAAWQHEYGDAAYEIDSSFANGAGNTFTVNGPRLGRDSFLLGAGFAVQFNERCATYFYYDGELGRTRYDSQSVSGGFRLAF